ncbi:recombination protein NinB [Cupriavidus respiraculi]|uniref:recombination protein NinB n=1 Tax=Cupriavidus respiraculi TaxID=195930 RepID=UPI001C93F648|nr:recombination protein NinB [Cupriavidus respiraculi]MBY4947018.1 recombination protein NinB [Cupriavidus respiraculi]
MSAVLYREFVLRGPSAWQSLVALVKANAKSFADKGEPLRLILTSEEKKRNAEQNRYLWGVVYRDIAEQAWVDGRQFDKDAWHEYFARMYGVCEDVELPSGEVVSRRKSTTQMSVGEFSAYTAQVQAYAANNLGVSFN